MTVMNLPIFDQVAQLGQEPLARDAASLYRAFEQMKDGRGRKGKRYPLALLFTLIVLGKMGGRPRGRFGNTCATAGKVRGRPRGRFGLAVGA